MKTNREEVTVTSLDNTAGVGDGAVRRERGRRHRGGAPLLPPAVAYVLLGLAGVVLPPAVAGQTPYSSDAEMLEFYAHHQGTAHLSAFLLLASSVPWVVFAAIASHRVKDAGLDVPGRLIALVGGTAAGVMLAVSGLTTLALTRPHVAASTGAVRALQGLVFATGGPGFVVFSGLLLAGISVPLLVGRLAARWVGWLGLGLAMVCELASATAATDLLDPLLPLGRFGAMAWMIAVAVSLSSGQWREGG